MAYFLQFYQALPPDHPAYPRGVKPVQEGWGQLDVRSDALQWEVEQSGRHLAGLMGAVGFRLWERDERCKVHPCGGIVRVKA